MTKKTDKQDHNVQVTPQVAEAMEQITSREDLKCFLAMVSQKMDQEQSPPIYVLTLMNHLMNLPNIYDCLDEENKETARAIWLRMKQQGMQLRNPPMLFGEDQP